MQTKSLRERAFLFFSRESGLTGHRCFRVKCRAFRALAVSAIGNIKTAIRLPIGSEVASRGQVAQSVEQRTENPCVGGSIPPLATIDFARALRAAKSSKGDSTLGHHPSFHTTFDFISLPVIRGAA
jgi:hypothetical protein